MKKHEQNEELLKTNSIEKFSYLQIKDRAPLNPSSASPHPQTSKSQKKSLPASKLDTQSISKSFLLTEKPSTYKTYQNFNPNKSNHKKSKKLMITLFSRENPNFKFENFKVPRPNHRTLFNPPIASKSRRKNFDTILGDFGLKTVKSVDEQQEPWGFAVDQQGVNFFFFFGIKFLEKNWQGGDGVEQEP